MSFFNITFNNIQKSIKIKDFGNNSSYLFFNETNNIPLGTFEEYYYNNTVMGDGFAANGRGYAYYTRYFRATCNKNYAF